MNETVQKNLAKMTGGERSGMEHLLAHESIGGNAGSWKGMPCQAANFYYSKWTGEIITFGNPQEVSPEIKENNPLGTFRIALNFKAEKSRIIQLLIEDKISDQAKKNLDETIRVYNEKQEFKEGWQ